MYSFDIWGVVHVRAGFSEEEQETVGVAQQLTGRGYNTGCEGRGISQRGGGGSTAVSG